MTTQPGDARPPVNVSELTFRADSLRHVHDLRIRSLVNAVDELADELLWLRERYVQHLIASGEIETYRKDTA